MNEMRAMLDELMGQDRDGDRVVVKKKVTDQDVCKHYLCGFCPFTEFERTKHDFGLCQNLHDESCKADWDVMDDRDRDRLGYERDLKKWLDKLMVDLKQKIARNEARLAAQEDVVLLPEDQARLAQFSDEIQESLAQAEALGETGNVDGAQACVANTERLKVHKAKFEEDAQKRAGGGASRYGQQEVCPFSGVIINKEESRVRDHKNGRNYRAWCMAHEKLKELNEVHAKRDLAARPLPGPPPNIGALPGPPPREANGTHPAPREAERPRDRDRDRDRRSSDRDRTRDRERDRGRERDGDRHRHREREREARSSHADRDSHRREHRRSRSRDRPRERDARYK